MGTPPWAGSEAYAGSRGTGLVALLVVKPQYVMGAEARGDGFVAPLVADQGYVLWVEARQDTFVVPFVAYQVFVATWFRSDEVMHITGQLQRNTYILATRSLLALIVLVF